MQNEQAPHASIYILPNSITLAALFAAFYAIIQAMHTNYKIAAIAVFASMIFDGLDGRVARLTNSQSKFGEQLDSLADVVSFGVAPALIVYMWQLNALGRIGYAVAFIYCACAALRLALFNTNIGKSDNKWFTGIPSPTAAALVAGLVWVHYGYEKIPYIQWVALIITLFAGLSMVVQIPFWSFKKFNAKSKVSLFVMLFIVLALLALSWQPSLILFLFFLLYSLSGYVMWLKNCLFRKRLSVETSNAHQDSENH